MTITVQNESLWERCISQLKLEFPEQLFNTFLRPLQIEQNPHVLKLFSPNQFVLNWVKQHCFDRITELTTEFNSADPIQIELHVGSAGQHKEAPTPVQAKTPEKSRRICPFV